MDVPVGHFSSNNVVPDFTQSSTQYNCRLMKNCKLVKKFLGDSVGGEKNRAVKENFNLSRASSSSEIPDQDSLAYAYFDKLWVSSKHHRSLLVDQWHTLMEKVKHQEFELNFKLASSHVAGILHLCKKLNTNFVVRFRALELYNRYLQEFARKYEDFLLNNRNREEVQEFKARFEAQILLRMCTCILIASKLHADTQIRALTTERIKEILANEGFEYTRNNIARSELRLMETLNYRCLWATPLELVEQLLGILDLPLEYLRRSHYYSILLLEYCYTDLDNIRDKFLTNIKYGDCLYSDINVMNSHRCAVSTGKVTVPLECAAIVAAALFIVSTETKTQLHKLVAKTANLNEEDVHVLAVILLDSLNVS